MSSDGNTSRSQDPTQPARQSGRPVFGADGRSSWEWQTSTGVFERDITDEQLSALQAPQLQLIDAADSITIRRPRSVLHRAPLHEAAKSPQTGKLRRLLQRVARLLS